MRAILTWHSIDATDSPISIAPAVFRRQMEWLRSGRVRVVGVEELLRLPADADAVALTFDDGFANFATEAAPLLLRDGLPSTVFVVTDHVGKDSRWSGSNDGVPVMPLMDWDTLGRLRAQGISIGAHTRTHPRLTTSGTDLDSELRGSADILERHLGERPTGLAYPYGAVDRRVLAAAAEFRWACTTEFRTVDGPWTSHGLPRLDAWYLRDKRLLDSWGTARFRAWIWARRQGRAARTALQNLAARR